MGFAGDQKAGSPDSDTQVGQKKPRIHMRRSRNNAGMPIAYRSDAVYPYGVAVFFAWYPTVSVCEPCPVPSTNTPQKRCRTTAITAQYRNPRARLQQTRLQTFLALAVLLVSISDRDVAA